ncbi:MAG: arginine--tRNA ligase [Candidatus Pacebacteria bacterium]|nr:arginine--tRNA ligase [Candidatus Paceibacterota bacterium]
MRENLKDENSPNGIFEYGDEQNGKRPIIYNGERVGLHNRVFINSEGLTTYEAKDIGNFETKLKYCEENNFPIDDSYSIVITANEQDAYFKVLYSALGELYKDKNIHNEHYSHGMMRFADGKMSSRKGNVIGGMDLINEVKDKLKEINPEQTEEERQS